MGNKSGKYTERTAREMIEKNGGTVNHRAMYHPQPGLRVLGAMDYLLRFGYYRSKVVPGSG